MECDRALEHVLTSHIVNYSDLGRPVKLSLQEVQVTSLSAIKVDTVSAIFHKLLPDTFIKVTGVKVPSGVDGQPIGQTTIDGALNRLAAARQLDSDCDDTTAWVSIENGLFRVTDSTLPVVRQNENERLIFSEDADLTVQFDPAAEYEDRAVAAIRLPGRPTIVQVSPKSESVLFPKAAVLAAHDDDGGFTRHTAGSKLAEMGLVIDKQNPHVELTVDRPGGPFSRQDQMTAVIIRALTWLQPI